MANPPKKARIKNVTRTNGSATITFVSLDGPLDFLGGQYVIFNSGVKTNEGKEIKRAYSILSSDRYQGEFQICVQPVEEGLASLHIPNLAIGSELEFSGPWGKFIGNLQWPREGKTLLVATDTGITAIFSILHSQRWKEKLKDTNVIWYVSRESEFLPVRDVMEGLPIGFNSMNVIPISKVNDPKREAECLCSFTDELNASVLPTNAFLAGDGKLIRIVKDVLLAKGVLEENIGAEIFFNSPRQSESVKR
ncbi:FAD-dependent oxidoreductase [Leptospira barantonii]|uniref:FAD-dependent oxidoreductase n=1 Tax=Leptospira barantonii TaxID=2023184 RepID=A0A5F2BDV1_9LEPT|nr:FAD-dependent oxidoreductase [Leptospira barantonii]TGM03662.1 FAD-dependent oxidoreductase [Leptospira barantonii]